MRLSQRWLRTATSTSSAKPDAAGGFIPRREYPRLDSIPRSYFLGHHAAGLAKMKTMLSQIDLTIECRDYRIPLSSRNPMFEESLGERPCLIVYTKQDLGSCFTHADKIRENTTRNMTASPAFFTSTSSPTLTSQLLSAIKSHASSHPHSPTGLRLLIVGMPNVGKSTLLNALRTRSLHKPAAARTGAQPGITRKIGSSVRIVDPSPSTGIPGGVYLTDTPGVFTTYCPSAHAMLKLALCACVKASLISPVTLADYLLYHLNLYDPQAYSFFCHPTNSIVELLEHVASRLGRLKKGGAPDLEAAALQFVQRWRAGQMGKIVLDDDIFEAMRDGRAHDALGALGGSMNQAKKAAKAVRRNAAVDKLER